MLIGFTGATGRTDASHAAILAARSLAAVKVRTTFVCDWTEDETGLTGDGSLDVVRAPAGRGNPAAALRRARAACRDGVVVADIPAAWLGLEAVRSSLDVTIVVVGPHEGDEREAAAFAGRLAGPSEAGRPWYLGCRRAGGGPAALGFAAAMAGIDPGAIVLPYAMPPLGRGEASALMRTAPGSRTLHIG